MSNLNMNLTLVEYILKIECFAFKGVVSGKVNLFICTSYAEEPAYYPNWKLEVDILYSYI